MPCGESYSSVLGLDTLVVLGNLLSFGELGVQLIEKHRGSDAADGILLGLVQEPAPIDGAVHVRVEENEQILIELAGGLAFHCRPSHKWQKA